MVSSVAVLTLLVVTVNVALVAPAGMDTLAGMTAVPVPDSVTVTPPLGAGRLIMTVPVEEVPPVTLGGETATPVRARGTIVTTAGLAALGGSGVMAGVAALTARVAGGALLALPATLTLAETAAVLPAP